MLINRLWMLPHQLLETAWEPLAAPCGSATATSRQLA